LDSALLSFIIPEGLSDYFEFDKVEAVKGPLIFNVAKKTIPKEFADEKLLSKSFYGEVSVRDFPLRAKLAF